MNFCTEFSKAQVFSCDTFSPRDILNDLLDLAHCS